MPLAFVSLQIRCGEFRRSWWARTRQNHSPSRGALCHFAPALTGVGCGRVSGTRTGTDGDDLGKIFIKARWRAKIKGIQFTVQGMDIPVPAQMWVVKWATLRRHLTTTAIRGWTVRPMEWFLRLARRGDY